MKPYLFLLVDEVEDVAEVEQRWRGDEDDLQDPEACVADGEGAVVADVLTARLGGVALEGRLLVAPRRLHRSTDDQDTEDEEDGEPYLEEERREEELEEVRGGGEQLTLLAPS